MKYKIFTSEKELEDKNTEIFESGVCGNASQYADLASSKHPTLNKWAMPVIPYVFGFFNSNELIDTLSSDWVVIPNK